jgi:beta-lactamase superfamily II metal-dependent hydrolase
MQVHFVNVGYGEATLITKDNFVMLIDGGTNRKEEYENPGCIRIRDYLKKTGISKVDLVVVTHIHDDHIGGIPEVLRNFPVSAVWINVKPTLPCLDMIEWFQSVREGNLSGVLFKNALESYKELLEECETRKIPIFQRGRGDGRVSPDQGLTVELLSPSPEHQKETLEAFEELRSESDLKKAEALYYEIDAKGNQTSLSLWIQAGKTAVLLTGDKVDGWDEIYRTYGNRLGSQILKVTHHGQADGMPQEMIQVSQPDIFVICSSVDKRFNSAHPTVIDRAYAYLKENRKVGGVFVTGCLGEGFSEVKEICAVKFICDENTGEISTYYVES